MGTPPSPRVELAEKVLPAPLLRSLKHVFAQGVKGCVLAGGTALAAYYAGHRRSDDLDFFTSGEPQQRAAVLAVKSLIGMGVALEPLSETNQYYEALCEAERHRFKVTVVLDSNLFRVGRVEEIDRNVQVAALDTLLKMKAATLVSRCGEKDLFDLIWLFEHFGNLGFGDLIRLGAEIDAGVDGEAMLASVSGAILREEACDFSLGPKKSAAAVFKAIQEFREKLLRGLAKHLENEPAPALGELVRKLGQFQK